MMEAAQIQPARASVLLVDDTPSNLVALSAVLKPLGTRIVEATSGKEALAHLEREAFACVLLDVQMPEMDGFEVARRMRAMDMGRELPIIFLTAIHRDEGYVRKGYQSGAADYITKPYDVDIVRARVKAFVDLYEQREQIRAAQVGLRTRERDEAVRRLVAFERIASAAVESRQLDAFLRELLDVFIGAADAADSVCILLRDGEELKVQACIGWNEEVDERQVVKVGDGYVGQIASLKKPMHLADASTSDLVKSSWIKARGTKGLFGVPMMWEGELIGVAHIGSMRASEFTDSERRLFAAMVDRASWAVGHHLHRERLFDALSAAPALISVVRVPSMTYDFANEALTSFLGVGDLVRKSLDEVGFNDQVRLAIERAHATGSAETLDEIETKGRIFRFTAQPMRNHAGSVENVLTFALDITEQVMARRAQELHEAERAALLVREQLARAEAESANRAKDEFLATVSHELRTPLNAILGWTVTARRDAPPEIDRSLAIIERNARSQARIVEDVLDISRIASGRLRLDNGTVEVSNVVRAAVDDIRPAADAKAIGLEASITERLHVRGDGERLQQIVRNLLSNAVKFTPSSGKVSIELTSTDGRARLVVRDTGEGISGDFLPHLFEPFRQGDGSTTRRHGGLGLGLAIVRQLVLAHGGTVEAKSEGIGRGSTLIVELPLAAEQVESTRPSAPNGTNAVRLDGLKVLVVDDDADARALFRNLLAEHGADVGEADCAREGLRMFDVFRPDVLISDIAMPGGDGYGFIRAVRTRPVDKGGRTPAIAVTAQARTDDGDRAFAAGFQSHLAKPVDLMRLVSTVANLAGVLFERDAPV